MKRTANLSGKQTFADFYAVAVKMVLIPFFFASIGFAIPIRDLFSSRVVWRGLIYTLLMLFGKLLTGLWLLRFSKPAVRVPRLLRPSNLGWQCWPCNHKHRTTTTVLSAGLCNPPKANSGWCTSGPASSAQIGTNAPYTTRPLRPTPSKPHKPLSLYPAIIIETAMVSRGEIGFLILSVAASKGIFKSSEDVDARKGSSEIFLIAIWAVTLCTVVGPIAVGPYVRRVRKLQAHGNVDNTTANPLGVWGIS